MYYEEKGLLSTFPQAEVAPKRRQQRHHAPIRQRRSPQPPISSPVPIGRKVRLDEVSYDSEDDDFLWSPLSPGKVSIFNKRPPSPFHRGKFAINQLDSHLSGSNDDLLRLASRGGHYDRVRQGVSYSPTAERRTVASQQQETTAYIYDTVESSDDTYSNFKGFPTAGSIRGFPSAHNMPQPQIYITDEDLILANQFDQMNLVNSQFNLESIQPMTRMRSESDPPGFDQVIQTRMRSESDPPGFDNPIVFVPTVPLTTAPLFTIAELEPCTFFSDGFCVNGDQCPEDHYAPYTPTGVYDHEQAAKIYMLCKDQHGCRSLQKDLEKGDQKTVNTIFNGVIPYINELMSDPFGNYLCQKLIEYCDAEQLFYIVRDISSEFVNIAKNMHGTRAVQKLIEYLDSPQQIYIAKKIVKWKCCVTYKRPKWKPCYTKMFKKI